MPRSGSNPGPDPRRAAEKAGRSAETWAAWLLRLKGYAILETRYRTPLGEIDLVARRGRTIVFVEVKHRRGNAAAALEAVNAARIVRAAEWFQSHHPRFAGYDFRFDVIVLVPGRWPRHLANAFSA